jgi:hypothetical protein
LPVDDHDGNDATLADQPRGEDQEQHGHEHEHDFMPNQLTN